MAPKLVDHMNHLGDNKDYQVLPSEDCSQEICFVEGFEDDDDDGGGSDDVGDDDDDEPAGEGAVFYNILMRGDPKKLELSSRGQPLVGFSH